MRRAEAMQEPLPYRSPDLDDPTSQRRRRTRQTLIVGVIMLAGGALLLFAPLALGRSELNRFIVVAALLTICWGASCLLLGGWDWLRDFFS